MGEVGIKRAKTLFSIVGVDCNAQTKQSWKSNSLGDVEKSVPPKQLKEWKYLPLQNWKWKRSPEY